MSWGDGSSDSNISCSGSTVSHTYPSNNSYTYVATVNSSSGSNTYSRTVNFATGGGTNYALLNTCTIANSVDISSNGSEIFALTSGGQIRRYDTNCGDETTMNVVSQPEGFGEAVSLSYCTGNNRITVADRLRDKVYIYAVSGDDMTYSHAITTNLDAPDDVFCSNANDIYVLDRGNRALKKFNAVGTQQCLYNGWGTAGTDIAVDNAGNIYATDHALNRVLKLTSGCAISTSISGLSNPRQLAVIPTGGELWVGDNGNNRIAIINPVDKSSLGIVAPSSAPLGMTIIGGDLYSLSGGTTIESFGPQ